MRSACSAILLIALAAAVLSAPGLFCPAEAGGSQRFVIAYSLKSFPEIDPKDAAAALTIWVAEYGRQAGYVTESHTFDNPEAIVEQVNQGKIDLISMSSIDYIRTKSRMDAEVCLAHVKGGKPSLKYLLLVKRSRGYTKLADLREKRLAMVKGDETGGMYLNTLLLKQKSPEMKTFFSSVEEKNKPSQVILSVFFGQADACIINDVSLMTTAEMNPQVGKELAVLASSPEMIGSITLFRKNLKEDEKQRTINVCKTLKDTSRGRQMLLLFKTEELAPAKESDLMSLKDLMAEYERLKGHR